MSESPQSLVIVGGGLAGLAAAVALAPLGWKIALVESKPRLGGRAGSFDDNSTGEAIDNCQHVSMGCCTNLTDFCRRVGIDQFLSQERTLYFQDETGVVSQMTSWPLPAPLHLAPSFLGLKFLTLGEKFRVLRGMLRLARPGRVDPNQPFRDWLLANGQTERTCDRYWGLILVSALNESLDRIDFRYARQVFMEGFLGHPRASIVEIPRVPLGDFYGEPIENWLRNAGVELRLQCAADQIEIDNGRFVGCRLKNGEMLHADRCLLAVPFQRVADLLPDDFVLEHPTFANLSEIDVAPITSVHVWFDRPVMDLPHMVPVGRTTQWLFRRQADSPTDRSQYIQAVISASRDIATIGREKILEQIIGEMREILPKARDAQVKHTRVVTERSATFSVVPGIDRLRPHQTTPIENLYLAGDYTQTGWPATMEGAVRSGYLAAASIAERRFVCPPLPRGLIARFLIREPDYITSATTAPIPAQENRTLAFNVDN